jgi:hypothetical protein
LVPLLIPERWDEVDGTLGGRGRRSTGKRAARAGGAKNPVVDRLLHSTDYNLVPEKNVGGVLDARSISIYLTIYL